MLGVARGFFIQDMTYGFDSLDGFVIYYKGQNGQNAQGEPEKWGVSSLKIKKEKYDVDATNVDLTNTSKYPSDGNWACTVELDPSPSPLFEQVYCTRTVASKNNFDQREIAYKTGVVVNAIGYKYNGPSLGTSEWVISG